MIKRHKNLLFVLILVLALVVRIIPLIHFSTLSNYEQTTAAISGDAKGYREFGLLFYKYGIVGIFDKEHESYFAGDLPITAFRLPVFPFILSLFYVLFGFSLIPIISFQILLDCGTTALVFLIAQQIFKEKWIWYGSSLLYALSPLGIMYSSSLYAENVFTFVFTLSLFIFIKGLNFYLLKQGRLLLFLSAFCFSITTLIKPLTFYFIFPLLLVLLALKVKKVSIYFFITIIFFAPISVWQLRNYIVYGHYSLSFQQGRELLIYRVGTCRAIKEKTTKATIWDQVQQPFTTIEDPFERSKAEGEAALEYVKAHPLLMTECTLHGMKNFFLTKDLYRARSVATPAANYFWDSFKMSLTTKIILSKAYLFIQYIEYTIIITGLSIFIIKKNSKKDKVFMLFLLGTILYVSFLVGIDGYSRYRYPITPVLAVLCFGCSMIIYREIKELRKIHAYSRLIKNIKSLF